jgi:selenide,water dikinase
MQNQTSTSQNNPQESSNTSVANSSPSATIKLTQTVQKGGCAAKIAAYELRKILSQVQFPVNDSQVIVDGGLFDDAAIYKISDELALVQTLDFFTPIVDTPRTFGMIAAANAISDVYAMGGTPKTAMAILAFPLATLDSQIATEVLQGASDVMKSAKVNFVGGHSIDDDTLKFGLSVTGMVHPQKIWKNSTAKSGQKLILTKALGTGTITAALKRNAVAESDITEALDSMSQLNNVLDFVSADLQSVIRSATDITGFGLMGHAMQMAKASQVKLEINFGKLPILKNAFEFMAEGFLTKAHKTNQIYTQDFTSVAENLGERSKILFDPQTSGGLLLAVDAEKADELLAELKKGFSKSEIVGQVTEFTGNHWVQIY